MARTTTIFKDGKPVYKRDAKGNKQKLSAAERRVAKPKSGSHRKQAMLGTGAARRGCEQVAGRARQIDREVERMSRGR